MTFEAASERARIIAFAFAFAFVFVLLPEFSPRGARCDPHLMAARQKKRPFCHLSRIVFAISPDHPRDDPFAETKRAPFSPFRPSTKLRRNYSAIARNAKLQRKWRAHPLPPLRSPIRAGARASFCLSDLWRERDWRRDTSLIDASRVLISLGKKGAPASRRARPRVTRPPQTTFRRERKGY